MPSFFKKIPREIKRAARDVEKHVIRPIAHSVNGAEITARVDNNGHSGVTVTPTFG